MKKLAYGLERSGITSRFITNEILNEKMPIIYFSTDHNDLIKSKKIMLEKVIINKELTDVMVKDEFLIDNIILKYTVDVYNTANLEPQIQSIKRIINFLLLNKISDKVLIIIDKIPQALNNSNLKLLNNLILTSGFYTSKIINNLSFKLNFDEVVFLRSAVYEFQSFVNDTIKNLNKSNNLELKDNIKQNKKDIKINLNNKTLKYKKYKLIK